MSVSPSAHDSALDSQHTVICKKWFSVSEPAVQGYQLNADRRLRTN